MKAQHVCGTVFAARRSTSKLRGDTAQGATKPAKLETGLVVNVPIFINQGDRIKVSTSNGEYLERVATA